MFNPPSRWLGDPFRPFTNSPTPFPIQTYTSSTTLDPYLDENPHKPRRHMHKGPCRHLSHSASDLNETDLDDTSDIDLPYSNRHRDPSFEHFPRTQLRLPKRSAQFLRPDQILILPPTLVNLKVTLHNSSHRTNTMRAAVAGDMRLRDVVKQILPQDYLCDARVYVRSRGEWVEPGSSLKVSEVVELGRMVRSARGEVEVRIVVARRESEGKRGAHGWEREVGRVDRMRVY